MNGVRFLFHCCLSFIFLTALLFSARGFAKRSENNAFEQTLIDGNIAVSQGIDSIADKLDMFLAKKRYSQKQNPTTASISNATYSTEGVGPVNSTHLSVNLRLPNLEKSWALRFTSYDENSDERGVRKNTLRGAPLKENYGTSLALFKQLGSVSTTFRPRIELRDPLRVSHVLRFDSSADMRYFLIKPKLELFATPSKGTGVFTALNFEKKVSERRVFSFFNESEYEEGRNLFSVDNGIVLTQSITDTSAISYSFVMESSSRPRYHLDRYVAATSWRHALYKRVFEYQLTPSLAFAKTRDFKGVAGISLNLRLIF